jgi:hypothetical protein
MISKSPQTEEPSWGALASLGLAFGMIKYVIQAAPWPLFARLFYFEGSFGRFVVNLWPWITPILGVLVLCVIGRQWPGSNFGLPPERTDRRSLVTLYAIGLVAFWVASKLFLYGFGFALGAIVLTALGVVLVEKTTRWVEFNTTHPPRTQR